ncbi:WXG100 family type VII secretion target [Streptomyces sp. NPDC057428]|uniref:WXG100 family type VII secretion target n=1 Tax=Streptomyces sp. NPDC057428 TaxID=3346129 RepID=UPI0036C73A9C
MTTSPTGDPEILATPRTAFAGDTADLHDMVQAGDRAREADPQGHTAETPAPLNDRRALVSDKGGSGGGHGNSNTSHGNMSAEEFRVALADLRHAAGVVRSESGHIADLIGQIQSCFEAARASWQSPSAVSFETMATWFTNASRAMEDLLQDMARRMQAAYDNYAGAETANTHNSGG